MLSSKSKQKMTIIANISLEKERLERLEQERKKRKGKERKGFY